MSGRGKKTLVVVAALVGLGTALYLLPIGEWTLALLARVERLGPWAGLALAVLWVPAAVLLVPGSAITLGTGFLLGVGWGFVVVSIGSTTGAAAAFLVGRRLARRRVERAIEARPRFRAVDRVVGEGGLAVVLLTRLSPLFPYNFLNYAFAVTGVRFRDFVLGSWIGMLPGTLVYVWLGSGARTLATLASGRPERGPWELALFALGLVATAAVTWMVTRRARAALEERIDAVEAAP